MKFIGFRRLLVTGLLAVLVCGSASAQQRSVPARVDSISVLEFGRYERGPNNSVQLIEQVEQIPARLGVSFGFRYVVEGPPSALPAELTVITRLPQRGGIVDPADGRARFLLEERIPVRIGDTNVTGFTFGQPWMITPGRWTFEIWAGGRKLGERSFEVVRQ